MTRGCALELLHAPSSSHTGPLPQLVAFTQPPSRGQKVLLLSFSPYGGFLVILQLSTRPKPQMRPGHPVI